MGYQNTPSAPGLANVRTHCVPQFKKFYHRSSKLFPHGLLLSIYSVELFNLQVGCLELLLVRRNQHLGFREPHLCLRISGIRHKNPTITESGINIGIIQQFTVLMCMLLYFWWGDETMENRMCFGELAHAPPGCACTCAFQMYLSADLLF